MCSERTVFGADRLDQYIFMPAHNWGEMNENPLAKG